MSLLEAKQLTFRVREKELLHPVDFALEQGQMIGLIGPNGAGKSTLLKLLANLQAPSSGECWFRGRPLPDYSAPELARLVGFIEQNAVAHWPLQVKRLVELGRLPYRNWLGYRTNEDAKAIDKAIAATEVEHLMERICTTLSGGELTRVMLARLLAGEPEVILADEPIASLDPYHQLHVLQILRQHALDGGACVVVLHDLNHALRFCDKLVLLHQGRVFDVGEPQQVLSAENLSAVYHIEAKTFQDEDGMYLLPAERRDITG